MSVQYPNGVPFRSPRPRDSNKPSNAILGALLVGALTRNPYGAVAGGVLGNAMGTETPVPFELALKQLFQQHQCELIELYRRGPFRIKITFRYNGGYWAIEAQAPRPDSTAWKQETLQDWLYGEVKVQLEQFLSQPGRH